MKNCYQVYPALLDKKDRGRGADLTVHPKAFGEKVIASGIPGAELLHAGESDSDAEEDDEGEEGEEGGSDCAVGSGEEGSELSEDEEMGSDVELGDSDEVGDENLSGREDEDDENEDAEEDNCDETNAGSRKRKLESEEGEGDKDNIGDMLWKKQKVESEKEKDSASTEQSLRHLKRMSAAKAEEKLATEVLSRDGDGILSNEDFQRIRELQVLTVIHTGY